jgi:hypothetical protein
MKLYTNRNIALGNGTRPSGFLLGETTAESVDGITLENTTLASGVSSVELQLALLNLDAVTASGPVTKVPNLVDPVYNAPTPTEGFVDSSSDPFADLGSESESEPNASDEGSQEDADTLVVSDSVRAMPVSELKPPKAVAKLLADGGITTVGELIDYADSHEGLTSLGLSEEQEAGAKAAIEKLLA